jgi:hypothetical protein
MEHNIELQVVILGIPLVYRNISYLLQQTLHDHSIIIPIVSAKFDNFGYTQRNMRTATWQIANSNG